MNNAISLSISVGVTSLIVAFFLSGDVALFLSVGVL
jgi:hypothetical protein